MIRRKFSLQVLSDDEKRPIYDQYGEAGLKGAGMGMGVSVIQQNDLIFYYLIILEHLCTLFGFALF